MCGGRWVCFEILVDGQEILATSSAGYLGT